MHGGTATSGDINSGLPYNTVVADCDVELDHANAQHIVKCVNAHDELVAALQAAELALWESDAANGATHQQIQMLLEKLGVEQREETNSGHVFADCGGVPRCIKCGCDEDDALVGGMECNDEEGGAK